MNLVIETIGPTVGWTVLAVVLFYGGLQLFDRLDPIDYRAQIERGNLAAGLLLSAVVVSLAAIVITVIVS